MPAPFAIVFAQPHILYRAFGPDNQLVYIGVTHNLPKRVTVHISATWWWVDEVSKVTQTEYPDRASALAAEAEAIRSEWPTRNSQHNGSRPRGRNGR